MEKAAPVRINKYLADHNYCTRKEADVLIEHGRVKINGRVAVLGDKVQSADTVEVKMPKKTYLYYAYHKPMGVITHSPQLGEDDIIAATGLKGIFPVGRLDKDSSGLIILTNDGRLTDALLNPEHAHEKEYDVRVDKRLENNFKRVMERGVNIEGYTTKPCTVHLLGEKRFSIALSEGKKHQIRRMCAALGYTTVELKRTRIMNVPLGNLPKGTYRALGGAELQEFLKSVGLA